MLLNTIIGTKSIFPSKSVTLLEKDLADSAHIAKSEPSIAPGVLSTCC